MQPLSTALRKIVAFLMQGDALALSADALALSADALVLSADALVLLANALVLSSDALVLSSDALVLSADALVLQGIAKFNSLRINEMLYLVKQFFHSIWELQKINYPISRPSKRLSLPLLLCSPAPLLKRRL